VFSDAMISGIVLLLLLAGLVLIDPRVREHALVGTSSSSSAVDVSTRLSDVTSAVVVAARHQSLEHAPMMIFVTVASVLFVAMFRS
jgi:hypothetical protein